MSDHYCWLNVEYMNVRPFMLAKYGMYECQTITAGYMWNVWMSDHYSWLNVECMNVRPLLLARSGMHECQTIIVG